MKAINECVCITVDGCDTPITRGQNEPYELQCKHATLFAASEDLLKALQNVMKCAKFGVERYGYDPKTDEDILFAESAIKKALGQA